MGYGLVDELAAVVGVKAEDEEGELPQHGGQHGLQPSFADAGGGAHDLPLRDLIDGVDVVDAFGSRSIALMHGIDAQIAGSALRVGPSALADAYCPGPGSARSSSRGSAAPSHGLCGLVPDIAVGAEPAPPSRKSACDFQLRTGSLRWRLEKPRSDPGSVSLHRARWLSILSMPCAPGSSCTGN